MIGNDIACSLALFNDTELDRCGCQILEKRRVRTGATITVPSWRMRPASEPTLATSATTVIAAPFLSETLTLRFFNRLRRA